MTTFDLPTHEPRYGYAAARQSDSFKRKDVVEVTYIPSAKKYPVQKSVASRAFLLLNQRRGLTISTPIGMLVSATNERLRQRNSRAVEVAGAAPLLAHRMNGPFYWIDVAPNKETWWRWSVPLDFETMPNAKLVKGRLREASLRLAIAEQIRQHLAVRSFFVETIWNLSDDNLYYFDIYAREETDLTAIKLLLTSPVQVEPDATGAKVIQFPFGRLDRSNNPSQDD